MLKKIARVLLVFAAIEVLVLTCFASSTYPGNTSNTFVYNHQAALKPELQAKVNNSPSASVSGQVKQAAPKEVQLSQDVSKSLRDIISEKGINSSSAQFKIVVDKSDHILSLYAGNILLKSYHVELGDKGLGDKQIEGDHKTPEGTFYICEKIVYNPSDEYLGTRWMRLSYPNIEDGERGLKSGLIGQNTYNSIVDAINNGYTPPQETPLGGAIGIHGGSTAEFGPDWTWGCVGLANSDIEEFYDYISVGTPVVIQK